MSWKKPDSDWLDLLGYDVEQKTGIDVDKVDRAHPEWVLHIFLWKWYNEGLTYTEAADKFIDAVEIHLEDYKEDSE